MPRFAANLSLMFTEWSFLDRFAAAADAGFTAVEYLFPYAWRPDDIAGRLQRCGLTQAIFNLPPGDWEKGERGLAALPDRRQDLRDSVELALAYVEATAVKRLHMMSGLGRSDDPGAAAAYRDAVAFAADRLGEKGLSLLLEPINSRDMPGYFLSDFDLALEIIETCGRSNVELQFDIYHRQILRGDVTVALRRLIQRVGHIQIASVPDRNEPDSGELDYGFLFGELDRLDYQGFVGCEYRPRSGTLEGLGWFRSMQPFS